MLQKILRLVDSSRTTLSGLSAAESKQVNEALSQLVLQSQAVVRATVVTADGLVRGSFPQQTAKDRISAMSAAMLSLGERICGELGGGEMRYAIIAGSKTTQLLIVLSKDYALELELRPNVSVDETLNTVTAQTQRVLETLWVSPTL